MSGKEEFYTLKGYQINEAGELTTAMEDYLEMICRIAEGKRNMAKGIRRLFGDTGDKNPAEEEWRGGVYLTTVTSSFEADILESKLRAADIPVVRRYEGASNYLEITLGFNSVYPIELYVPKEALTEAVELIQPVPIEDDYIETRDGEDIDEE